MAVLFLLCAFVQNAYSIPSQIKFQRINVEHGLSQSDVNDVLQDDLGFMWIATQYGLNRFDGKTYDYFHQESSGKNSLSSSSITRLFKANDDRIWVLTSHGLDSINQRTLNVENWTDSIFQPLLEQNLIEKSNRGTISEFQVTEQYIYALVNFDFVIKVDLTSKIAELVKLMDHSDVKIDGIAIIANTEIMIHGANCFKFYLLENFTRTREHCATTNLHGQRFYTNSLQGSKLYMSYVDGLYVLDLKTFDEQYLQVFDSATQSFVEAEVSLEVDDGYWLGTIAGLKFYDKVEKKVTQEFKYSSSDEYSLSHDGIMMIYKSSDDSIWIATNFGISILKPYQSFSHLLRKTEAEYFKQSNFTTTITEDSDKNLWLGTYNSGLYKYNSNRALLENFVTLKGQSSSELLGYVSKVFEDDNQNLWVLASNGLSVKHINSDEFQHLPSITVENKQHLLGNMYDILQDRYSNYWTGSAEGLFKIKVGYHADGSVNLKQISIVNYKEKLPKNYLNSDHPIYVIFEDLQGYIWLGGTNGVVRFNPINLKAEHFQYDPSNSSSLSSSDISSMYEDDNGVLWIATNNGLNRVHYNNSADIRFKRVGVSDGFVSNYINAMEADANGFLWISTIKGITRYHPGNVNPVKNYLHEQGLQHSEFFTKSSYKDSNGLLYFGGVNGVTVFDPMTLEIEDVQYPIQFTAISQGDLYLTIDDSKTVQLKENGAIRVKVSNFDYLSNRKLNLRYRLKGFSDWIEIGDQDLILHRISAPLTLEVEQLSPAGLWLSPGIELNFVPKFELFNNEFIMPVLIFIFSILLLGFGYWIFLIISRQRNTQELAIKRERAKQSLLMEEKISLLHQVEDLHYSLSEQKYLVSKAKYELEQTHVKDEITNLFSRAYIIKNIKYELKTISDSWNDLDQKGIYLGIFCVEIDNFNTVKELHGLLAANEILMQVADAITDICYGSDIIARWQGSSILILSRGISQREQMVLAEKIRNVVASRKFDLSNGKTVDITVSIGFSRYPFLDRSEPEDNINWSKLIFLTETALSSAQSNSLNAWIGIYSNQFTNIETLNQNLFSQLPKLFSSGQLDYVSSIPKSKKIIWD